jgi:cell division protein FtsW
MRQLKLYDKYFLFAIIAISAIGLLMVASASMAISEKQYHEPFHYLFNQGLHFVLGILLAIIVLRIRVQFWHKISSGLLLFGIVLLIAVLIPGIGRSVNGSIRWIGVGPFGLQVSEFIKLAFVIYLSSYLDRRRDVVTSRLSGFMIPMMVLGVIAFFLMLEPDFGATVVVGVTGMTMMFLAGVRLKPFAILLAIVLVLFAILAVSAPYRLARLTGFLHPWSNQFDSGYQLTQSLIAFGRGGLFGVGLGDSIQKLFYLPEAHTDFLFAVLAEELGLLGILFVIGSYVLLLIRGFVIGRRAQLAKLDGAGFMAYGIAVWLGMQAFVNMGVNAGLLPTKGLTLPLISYGGSSLLIVFVAIALILRVDFETHKKDVAVEQFRRSLYKG